MRPGIIEKTLASLTQALEQSLFAETMALRKGLLQSLDPRVKVLSILALLFAVSLSRNLTALLGLYGITLFLAIASSIPMIFFIKRVWLFIPFFTGMIILPALFITPGPPLATLPFGLIVTQTGAQTAAFLLLRVGASVSLAVLLMLTTSWPVLLKALSVLHIPDGFLFILGMTYRYIFLLLRIAEDMFTSRLSRIVGRMNSTQERHLIAATAGTLLTKSLDLSSDVYLAMQARGYRGQARALITFRFRATDWFWGSGVCILVLLSIWLGR